MTLVHRLDAAGARAQVDALAAILVDCVDGGASVNFMAPFPAARAVAFWEEMAARVERGERALFVAEEGGAPVGTVMLILEQVDNQRHRADITKMLVHSRARRRGVGEALMRAAEVAARAAGRTLLVLDTVTGSAADRLYRRLGWQAAGTIPGYALFPDGRPCDATFFFKSLAGEDR